jgi:hypothetical protein
MDDRGEARLNGRRVLEYSGWSAASPPQDVAALLHPGANTLELCASNWAAPDCHTEDCNPGGVVARLDVDFAGSGQARREHEERVRERDERREEKEQLHVLQVPDHENTGPAARCPSSFAEAQAADSTAMCRGSLKCSYPEGECRCRPRCSGAYMVGMPSAYWTCGPHPTKRTDGCPEAQPADGTACSHSGQSCGYGDCCIMTVKCESGRWRMGLMMCPP